MGKYSTSERGGGDCGSYAETRCRFAAMLRICFPSGALEAAEEAAEEVAEGAVACSSLFRTSHRGRCRSFRHLRFDSAPKAFPSDYRFPFAPSLFTGTKNCTIDTCSVSNNRRSSPSEVS